MNRETKLSKNTFILGIGNVIPKLSSFIVLPILTGHLSKSEYGAYDLILVLAALLLPAVTLQLQTAAFRFLIDEKNNFENQKKIVTNIFSYILPVTLFIIIILFFILSKYTYILRLLIGIYFLFDLLRAAVGQIARGLGYNKIYALGSVVSSTIELICTLLLIYYFDMGLIGVLICLCLSNSLATIYMSFKVKLFKYLNLKLVDKKELKKLIHYSWPMVPNSLSMWVMNASDRLVLTFFLGLEASATYAVAKKLPNVLTILQNTFTMAWQESASLASKDLDSASYYSKMFDIIFSIMAGLMMLLSASMPLLFKILIHGNYDEAYMQIPIILISMFFFSIASYLGGIYIAQKKTKNVGITTFVAAIINFLTCIIMVNSCGVYAASISTLISYLVLMIFRMIDINKYIKIEYNFKRIVPIVASLILVTFISFNRNMIFNIFNIILSIILTVLINKKIIVELFKYVKKKLNRKGNNEKREK